MPFLPAYPCSAVLLSCAVPLLFPAFYSDRPVQLHVQTQDCGTALQPLRYTAVNALRVEKGLYEAEGGVAWGVKEPVPERDVILSRCRDKIT